MEKTKRLRKLSLRVRKRRKKKKKRRKEKKRRKMRKRRGMAGLWTEVERIMVRYAPIYGYKRCEKEGKDSAAHRLHEVG